MPWADLPPEVIRSGAPWLLVFLLVTLMAYSIVSGRLMTRRGWERERAELIRSWEARLAESKEYASALLQVIRGYQELDNRRDERMDDLLEGNRVITETLASLPLPRSRGRPLPPGRPGKDEAS